MIIYKARGLNSAGTHTGILTAQIDAAHVAGTLGVRGAFRSTIWRPTHIILQA